MSRMIRVCVFLLALLRMASSCSAFFVSTSPTDSAKRFGAPCKHSSARRANQPRLEASYELLPEPEGGDELTQITSMPNSRMKNMGVCGDVETGDGGIVHNFWLSTAADASLIKKLRTQILKESARKANFPGFRKGQIPPYAQPQITTFALQEAIIATCESCVEAFGLKALKGSDGEVEVKEDVQKISQSYKQGEDVPFTATLRAEFDPEKQIDEPAVLDTEIPSEGEESLAASE